MKRFLVILVLLLQTVTALAGVQGTAGPYRIDAVTRPEVIPVGEAQLRLKITDAAGKPMSDLTVKTLAAMPGMFMGEKEITASPVSGEPGIYSGKAAFPMGGGYDVRVSIDGSLGPAETTLKLSTGQNTGNTGSRLSLGALIPWIIGLAAILFVLYRMRATGQRANWRDGLNRGTLGGLLLLGILFFGATLVVRNFRRPGSMTPIEAQVMEMNTPAPPGSTAVELTQVKRGRIVETVRYSGQAVGFAEQDVTGRVTGTILSMPVYVGDRVKKGQVLVRLDTSQLDPQLAERAAMTSMAVEGVGVAAAEYQTALQEIAEARADVSAKEAGISEAEAMVSAAEQDRSAMAAEVIAEQSEVANAEAEVISSQQNAKFLADELTRAQTLYDEKLLSRSDLQKAESEAADALAKQRQAQSMVRGAESKVTAARAGVRKADAMLIAAKKRVEQARAELRAAKSAVLSRQRAADSAKRNVSREQAGVAQARAGYQGAAAQKGYALIKSEIDGVVTQRLISPGTLVNPGQSILKVAQITPIRLQANVPLVDLERIRIGSLVTIKGRTSDDPPITTRVSSVGPSVDTQSRMGVVEVVWPNGSGRILPGQFLSMEIEIGKAEDSIYVPAAAIDRGGFVWVAEPTPAKGRFTVSRVKVETGQRDGKNIAIRTGLKEGQQVVTTGGGFLREGGEVSAAIQTKAVAGVVVEVTSAAYEPNEVRAEVGKPITITFIRRTDQTCGTEVIFPDLKLTRALPLNKPVEVTFTPTKAGDMRFTCAMDMFDGKVVVK